MDQDRAVSPNLSADDDDCVKIVALNEGQEATTEDFMDPQVNTQYVLEVEPAPAKNKKKNPSKGKAPAKSQKTKIMNFGIIIWLRNFWVTEATMRIMKPFLRRIELTSLEEKNMKFYAVGQVLKKTMKEFILWMTSQKKSLIECGWQNFEEWLLSEGLYTTYGRLQTMDWEQDFETKLFDLYSSSLLEFQKRQAELEDESEEDQPSRASSSLRRTRNISTSSTKAPTPAQHADAHTSKDSEITSQSILNAPRKKAVGKPQAKVQFQTEKSPSVRQLNFVESEEEEEDQHTLFKEYRKQQEKQKVQKRKAVEEESDDEPQIDEAQIRHIFFTFYTGLTQNLTTSKLGAVLYKNENYPEVSSEKRNRTFVIWKSNYKGYGAELKYCKVSNCIITGNESSLQSADAVIVRLQLGIIPKIEHRDPKQRWLFLNDEAPHNAFSLAKRKIPLSEMDNVFNWSLTYRSDADVPIPYGRTVALKTPIFPVSNPPISGLVPGWEHKKRDVFIAILISNCNVFYRKRLINEVKQSIPVDVYGKCGVDELKNSCPGHFLHDCSLMSNYLFYLALENSKCYQYMTEKLFFNAYSKGAIPIIQGPSAKECEMFLPPKSYLHVDNYSNVEELADHITRIAKNETELLSYHRWRNHFMVLNEHGYFGVKPRRLCRVCEALNYNDDVVSVYSKQKLRQFLDPDMLCRK